MGAPHTGSRWYTLDLHAATLAPWHPGVYPGVEEISVKRLYPGADSLLQVGVCCKLLDGQVFLKECKILKFLGGRSEVWGEWSIISQPWSPNKSHFLLAVWDPVISISLDPWCSTCMASDLQQTRREASWLQTHDTYFLYAGIKPWCQSGKNSYMLAVLAWRSDV
jgi:hypothetical protein